MPLRSCRITFTCLLNPTRRFVSPRSSIDSKDEAAAFCGKSSRLSGRDCQHFGAAAIPGKPVIGEPHSLQFVRPIEVTKALALPLIRLNALLQAGVVEVAEGAKHSVQRHGLRSGRMEAVLIGPQHSTTLLRF